MQPLTLVELAMDGVYIYNAHGINGATPEETMRNMGSDRITWYDRNGENYCGYS